MTSPVVTDATLRKQLLNEIDGFEDAMVTDRMLAARMLLNWASNAVNFSVGGALVQATTDFVLKASAAEVYYGQFLAKKGAVYCSGMALFFDRLLKAFGYDSFTIDFGDLGDWLTHVVVIVPVWDGTGWEHHIFDPTFNTTFHDRATGCQMDVFEVIDALEGDALDGIVALAESLESRDWISIGPRTQSNLFLRDVMDDRYVYGRDDGTLTHYLERNSRELERNGYACGLGGFVQLMRARIFSIGSSSNPAATQDFARQLEARGIPLGNG